MMDKQMIEEIAKIMFEKAFENYETSGSVEIDTEVRRNFYSAFLVYCEALYNAGYRKIPEGAVVLTREEYEKFQALRDDYVKGYEAGVDEGWDNARKETAEKLLNKVDYESNGQTKAITDLLRKEYGVETK